MQSASSRRADRFPPKFRIADGVPHGHVEGQRVVVIAIETRAILAGGVVPAKRIKPALADIADHAVQYLAEYRRLNP